MVDGRRRAAEADFCTGYTTGAVDRDGGAVDREGGAVDREGGAVDTTGTVIGKYLTHHGGT